MSREAASMPGRVPDARVRQFPVRRASRVRRHRCVRGLVVEQPALDRRPPAEAAEAAAGAEHPVAGHEQRGGVAGAGVGRRPDRRRAGRSARRTRRRCRAARPGRCAGPPSASQERARSAAAPGRRRWRSRRRRRRRRPRRAPAAGRRARRRSGAATRWTTGSRSSTSSVQPLARTTSRPSGVLGDDDGERAGRGGDGGVAGG